MENKSPIIQEARRFFQDILDRIDRDECNENELLYLINKAREHSMGYYKDGDFMTYDAAMRELGIGGRNTLKAFLDGHGVKTHKISNHSVGFLRTEIEALAGKAEKPAKRRKRATK